MNYEKGGCKKEKHKKELSQARSEALDIWKDEVYSYDLLEDLLYIPDAAKCADVASDIDCSCCKCSLAAQPDFLAQRSWLEEVYAKYNALHGTCHRCMFLPKFHPELNPIERVWSMMKRHCRKFSNGSMSTLTESMNYGLSPDNISVATVRRICRYTTCYLYAYENGMDIIQAEQWMKKRRSHRGYSSKMDSELAAIYYPLGLPPNEPVEFNTNNSPNSNSASESINEEDVTMLEA